MSCWFDWFVDRWHPDSCWRATCAHYQKLRRAHKNKILQNHCCTVHVGGLFYCPHIYWWCWQNYIPQVHTDLMLCSIRNEFWPPKLVIFSFHAFQENMEKSTLNNRILQQNCKKFHYWPPQRKNIHSISLYLGYLTLDPKVTFASSGAFYLASKRCPEQNLAGPANSSCTARAFLGVIGRAGHQPGAVLKWREAETRHI